MVATSHHKGAPPAQFDRLIVRREIGRVHHADTKARDPPLLRSCDPGVLSAGWDSSGRVHAYAKSDLLNIIRAFRVLSQMLSPWCLQSRIH
jgi:hypothetical protein